MNKTILIAGGAAVASLAVGAAGGYFIAKKRFDDSLPEIIERETAAVKKYYSVMLMDAKSGKPASPADIPQQNAKASDILATPEVEEIDGSEEEPEQLTEKDKAAIAKGRESLRRAKQAMTDYQGISTAKVREDPNGSTPVIQKNIFDSSEKTVFDNISSDGKKPQRPIRDRDPESGRFVSTHETPATEPEVGAPYLISQEAFLENDLDFEQESCLYFVRDKTVVLTADPTEEVEVARVGANNLKHFPQVPADEPSIICVRNEAIQMDYEIHLRHDSLTAYIGLGENGDDEDAEQLERARYL